MGFFQALAQALAGLIGQPVKPSAPSRWPTTAKPVPAAPKASPKPVAAGTPRTALDYTAYADGTITAGEAYRIALSLKAQHPELASADAFMAATMAVTEAGGNGPIINLNATRYEPAFHRRYVPGQSATLATSYGPMQLLLNTALETYRAGYKAYGEPTPASLKNPIIGMYFGMAYQVRIRRRAAANGRRATVEFVVMSYNGGFGADNSQTRNHLKKYLANQAVVQSSIA